MSTLDSLPEKLYLLWRKNRFSSDPEIRRQLIEQLDPKVIALHSTFGVEVQEAMTKFTVDYEFMKESIDEGSAPSKIETAKRATEPELIDELMADGQEIRVEAANHMPEDLLHKYIKDEAPCVRRAIAKRIPTSYIPEMLANEGEPQVLEPLVQRCQNVDVIMQARHRLTHPSTCWAYLRNESLYDDDIKALLIEWKDDISTAAARVIAKCRIGASLTSLKKERLGLGLIALGETSDTWCIPVKEDGKKLGGPFMAICDSEEEAVEYAKKFAKVGEKIFVAGLKEYVKGKEMSVEERSTICSKNKELTDFVADRISKYYKRYINGVSGYEISSDEPWYDGHSGC